MKFWASLPQRSMFFTVHSGFMQSFAPAFLLPGPFFRYVCRIFPKVYSFWWKGAVVRPRKGPTMVTLYGIKNCSTVKKAITWLDEHGVEFQFHDFRKDGLPPELLAEWVAELGWEKLINRAGMTFRRLDASQKENLNEEKAVSLMLAAPTLIRRPVLVTSSVTLGFKPDLYEALFKNT